MAVVNLLGVQDVDFTANDGKLIKGIKLHIGYPDPHVSGLKVDTKFLRSDFCQEHGITVNQLVDFVDSDIDLVLNINGIITDVKPVVPFDPD